MLIDGVNNEFRNFRIVATHCQPHYLISFCASDKLWTNQDICSSAKHSWFRKRTVANWLFNTCDLHTRQQQAVACTSFRHPIGSITRLESCVRNCVFYSQGKDLIGENEFLLHLIIVPYLLPSSLERVSDKTSHAVKCTEENVFKLNNGHL